MRFPDRPLTLRYISVCIIMMFVMRITYASPLSQSPKFATSDYITDTEKIVKAPTQWDMPTWAKAVGIIGATAALYAFDKNIQQEIQEERNGATNQASSLAQPFGNVVYLAPSLGIVYFIGNSNGNSKLKNTALLGLESVIISSAFTGALKVSTQRARPYTGLGPNSFYSSGLSLNNNTLSFPSDHAASAFALASVISSEYGSNNSYVSPIAYGLASLTGLSRLNDNQHWASDVFLGSAIGYFTAKAIVRFHPGESGYTILPMMSEGSSGFMLIHRF